MLGEVTALTSDPEHASGLSPGHVLYGHDNPLLPRLAQGSGLPTLQWPARCGWMRHYDGHLHSARQHRDPHQRLLGTEPPGAAKERDVEGQDREAVPLGEISEIVLLMRVPAFVHHDLDPIVADLGGPGVDPFEAKRVERTRAEN